MVLWRAYIIVQLALLRSGSSDGIVVTTRSVFDNRPCNRQVMYTNGLVRLSRYLSMKCSLVCSNKE